jgi:transitional endoplasmic reticulum ATPase
VLRKGVQPDIRQVVQTYVHLLPCHITYIITFLSKDYFGEEYAMAEVFRKARQNTPCIIILEDLDSLVNDQNRSFFLNELDGLEGNEGILLVGSTNHLDRLDPGLSARPSRFDRK